MNKQIAIQVFGSVQKAAEALGVTRQAIYQWPDKFNQSIVDRINGAALRLGLNPEVK